MEIKQYTDSLYSIVVYLPTLMSFALSSYLRAYLRKSIVLLTCQRVKYLYASHEEIEY